MPLIFIKLSPSILSQAPLLRLSVANQNRRRVVTAIGPRALGRMGVLQVLMDKSVGDKRIVGTRTQVTRVKPTIPPPPSLLSF